MGVKKIFQFALFVTIVLFAAFSAATDVQNRHANLNYLGQQIVYGDEASQTIKKSIQSAVRIISTTDFYDIQAITATSSGTYFKHGDFSYVLTSAHSLVGDCYNTMILADEFMFDCHDIILYNEDKDIAIMQVENIFNRNPIKLSDFLSSEEEIINNTGVHQKILYTGYPQSLGPFTLDGKIVSHYIENDMFFVHSYAWAGSSGSGVFNSRGKLVGVITAVSVANSEYGVDVMEDLIIVTSLSLVDFGNSL